ncbi:hypothetical protein DYD21_17455 [Rhodohalobacter sp. SW132]|uniref:PP2C family protein-serine/threonine phosphatase n=1 Tax=Rhodohalobacter sp. SW132 TaxID=2293433 RepID=UPI000E2425F7|nr:SpoIIE family protein phosphatase [Rhodohalobacter sp. SW132]REL24648.1 hypothetical protein DYD21_17455 [Rhodohalobacter sp. SW132]
MKNSHTDSRGLTFWIILGLAGFVLFSILFNRFHYSAEAPITYSKEKTLSKTSELYADLGIESDTLSTVIFRHQRSPLYRAIRDSLENESPTPAQLNAQGFHLHGWDVISASTLGLTDSFTFSPRPIFESYGFFRTQYDNSGRITNFQAKSDRGASANVDGENSLETAQHIIEQIFGHELEGYEQTDISVDEVAPRLDENAVPVQRLDTPQITSTFRWARPAGSYREYIELELSSVPASDTGLSDADAASIVSIERFEAWHEMEKIPPKPAEDYFVILFISVIALLALFTFIEGLGQVFKGKADWRRIFFIALAVTIGIYGWRLIFLLNFTDLLTVQANLVVQFNQLVFGLVMGLFASVAYIGWEAHARSEEKYEMNLIDAYWRGKLYLKETGGSIIRGFSLAGVMLGITALFLTVSGLFMMNSDSQFGFTEVINRPQFLSINLSMFIVAALASIAMVGIVYHFFRKRIKNPHIVMAASIVVGGAVFTGLGRSFATTGSELNELVLFIMLAVLLFYTYRATGVVTVFSAFWLYSSIITIMPYIGSPSFDVSVTGWLQIVLALSVLLFGIVAWRKGPSISTVRNYVPEYEQKMRRNIRIENEMQIARESQQRLMPHAPLKTNHYELQGYFLPSFEVGGDYFDYVEAEDAESGTHLTLTVVDVSGKSMRAAMQAVFTSGLLRSRMYTDQPEDILREISPVVYDKTDSRTFITCVIGRYEPASRTLKLANAGHCMPILKRNGKAEYLRTPDPKYPLGVRPQVRYKELLIKLQPGDLILFYSDGFPEAVNENGERIGFERARRYVEEMDSGDLSAREICTQIKSYVEDFSVERLADDTTILCLKIV